MSVFVFLTYLLQNLLDFGKLPKFIHIGEYSYYSCVYYDKYMGTDKWIASYMTLVNNETDVTSIIEVTSRYRYIVYLKMVFALWKTRKNIDYIAIL